MNNDNVFFTVRYLWKDDEAALHNFHSRFSFTAASYRARFLGFPAYVWEQETSTVGFDPQDGLFAKEKQRVKRLLYMAHMDPRNCQIGDDCLFPHEYVSRSPIAVAILPDVQAWLSLVLDKQEDRVETTYYIFKHIHLLPEIQLPRGQAVFVRSQ